VRQAASQRLTRPRTAPYRRSVGRQPDASVCPLPAGCRRHHLPASSSHVPPLWSPRREQAHLPAEQSPPCPHPRLPAAHAHPGRTSNSCRPPQQGPDQAVRLSPARLPSMLPAAHRVRRRGEFAAAIRSGQRAARPTLVVHYRAGRSDLSNDADPARAGFVVGRAVGNAVTRNVVRRRLRELVRPELHRLPPGSLLVVRALPPAAGVRSSQLQRDLEAALARVHAGAAS
jgi:ribonuclease P protein component